MDRSVLLHQHMFTSSIPARPAAGNIIGYVHTSYLQTKNIAFSEGNILSSVRFNVSILTAWLTQNFNCKMFYFPLQFIWTVTSNLFLTMSLQSDKYLTLYVQFWAPDDGRKARLKHVEYLIGINKLRNIMSCWLYSENILAMHGPMNVKFTKVSFA